MAADKQIDQQTVAASDEATANVRGGRKPLPEAEARSIYAKFRVNESELAQIHLAARSVGMRPTVYMRERALGFSPKSTPAPQLDALIAELNRLVVETGRIGNNINQLTRSVHRNSDFQQYYREIGEEHRELAAAVHAALLSVLERCSHAYQKPRAALGHRSKALPLICSTMRGMPKPMSGFFGRRHATLARMIQSLPRGSWRQRLCPLTI